jgi:hypothetical protein
MYTQGLLYIIVSYHNVKHIIYPIQNYNIHNLMYK